MRNEDEPSPNEILSATLRRQGKAMKHRFLLTIFSIAVLTVPTHAYSDEIPADPSKWLVMGAPDMHDESYWDAYEDDKHRWVVFLQDDRPSVRLWKSFREKDSYYSSMQESYPPIPFQVEQDLKLEGHSGAWLSTKVSDGWIIGFNKENGAEASGFIRPMERDNPKFPTTRLFDSFRLSLDCLRLLDANMGTPVTERSCD